jgi:hypothetical protein
MWPLYRTRGLIELSWQPDQFVPQQRMGSEIRVKTFGFHTPDRVLAAESLSSSTIRNVIRIYAHPG